MLLEQHSRPHSSLALLGLTLIHRLILGRKLEANAVDAVPLVGGGRVAFALEYVPEVAAAVGADDLDAGHAQRSVLVPGHGAGDAVEVGGPPAARRELVARLVQWGVAAGAGVDSRLGRVLVELAGARSLCALFTQDAELLCVWA